MFAICWVKVLRSSRPGPLIVTVAAGAIWLFRRSCATDDDEPRVVVLETPPLTTRLPGTANPAGESNRAIAPLTYVRPV